MEEAKSQKVVDARYGRESSFFCSVARGLSSSVPHPTNKKALSKTAKLNALSNPTAHVDTDLFFRKHERNPNDIGKVVSCGAP